MRAIKIGKHEVKIYDAIEELPISRFHKFQKCLLVDSGLGSTIEDVDKHLEKARRFCMLDKAKEAEKELMNMRQNIWLVQNGISPKHLSFAALVFAIDGKECTDLSDDALTKIVETFADAPIGDLTEQIASVKKKIDDELTLYFPDIFNGNEAREFYDKLRERTLKVLQNIVDGLDSPEGTEDVESLTTELMTYSNPECYEGSGSVEIQYDKQFEKLCVTLAKELNINPKEKTVLEFYNAFEYLKEKSKAEEQAGKQVRKRT